MTEQFQNIAKSIREAFVNGQIPNDLEKGCSKTVFFFRNLNLTNENSDFDGL